MARAWVFGDDLDTDQIVPGRYAPFMVGQEKFHTYAFCDARPEFAKEVRPGDVLVGGENFGCGSSREYAVAALVKHGVGAIVAKSFARIFFRNAINIGLPLLESEGAPNNINAGDVVEVDLATGKIKNLTNGLAFTAKPYPDFMAGIIAAGGLI
ncbi:MAG: 3-isopropylmalate dehydratase small subunit, partial [Chloroflexota bacterium]